MDRSQLMKGILEGCILKIIDDSETYGYEIVNKLQEKGFREVKEGTLYPLLLRLEKKKLIQAAYKPSPLGPSRKYYSLTAEGRSYVDDFYESWLLINKSIREIFKDFERRMPYDDFEE